MGACSFPFLRSVTTNSMIKSTNPRVQVRLPRAIRPRGSFILAKEVTKKLSLNGISNRTPIEPLLPPRQSAGRKQ
jgi:hypothetical protein